MFIVLTAANRFALLGLDLNTTKANSLSFIMCYRSIVMNALRGRNAFIPVLTHQEEDIRDHH